MCCSGAACSPSSRGSTTGIPKMTGRMYDERLGKLHFWMTFIGFNVTFGPMHWLGLEGMPRRVADYADKFAAWNLVSSIGAFLLGAATLVFVYNFVASWAAGPRAPGNPWRARTLEWQVSSPPPIFNFDEIPQVVGGPYEYGVPGSVHAVLNGDRKKVPVGAETTGDGHAQAPAGNGTATATVPRRSDVEAAQPTSEQSPAHVLVVANETVGGQKLIDAIERRAARGPIRCTVVCPQNTPKRGLRDLRRQRAVGRARAPRPDARAAPRDGHRGPRRGDGPRPLHGDPGRDPGVGGRRDHHLDVPVSPLGMAAARPRRAHRDAGPACRSSTWSSTCARSRSATCWWSQARRWAARS